MKKVKEMCPYKLGYTIQRLAATYKTQYTFNNGIIICGRNANWKFR